MYLRTISIELKPEIWCSTTPPLTTLSLCSLVPPYLIKDYFNPCDIIRTIGIEPIPKIWKILSLPLTYARLFFFLINDYFKPYFYLLH